jgi:hypothetical protein
MKKRSRFAKRSGEILSLNENRDGKTWQEERGIRYGNARKAKSKQKIQERRIQRKIENNTITKDIKEFDKP